MFPDDGDAVAHARAAERAPPLDALRAGRADAPVAARQEHEQLRRVLEADRALLAGGRGDERRVDVDFSRPPQPKTQATHEAPRVDREEEYS